MKRKPMSRPRRGGKMDKKIIFKLPDDLRYKAKIVCVERDISLSEFIRESMSLNLKKYQSLFK